MDFPHNEFGLPIRASYAASLDLALIRSKMSSGWVRQRRAYTHGAMLYTVAYRLTTAKAGALVDWLQTNNDWFSMLLLTSNDVNNPLPVHRVDVRRTTVISCVRISSLDQFTVSFQVETREMADFETLRDAAAGQPAISYPQGLPWPKMDGFSSEHGDRNITTYSLTYRMNTAMLKRWQAFAAFAGTNWFSGPMVSPNVFCGNEYMRYISNPEMSLVRPDVWQLTVQAETIPASYSIEGIAPPEGGGGGGTVDPPPVETTPHTYDDPTLEYDEAGHPFDCVAEPVTPPSLPTGVFLTPTSPILATDVQWWYNESIALVRVYGRDHPTYPMKVVSWVRSSAGGVSVASVQSLSGVRPPDGGMYVRVASVAPSGVLVGSGASLPDDGYVEFSVHAKAPDENTLTQVTATAVIELTWNSLVASSMTINFTATSNDTDIVTPVVFVEDLATQYSNVYTPWYNEAVSNIVITGPTNSVAPHQVQCYNFNKITAEETTTTADYVFSGETAPAGTYQVRVSAISSTAGFSPAAGTYSLPISGAVSISLSALGTSNTVGQTRSSTAFIEILHNGSVVTTFTASLYSRSSGNDPWNPDYPNEIP